MAIRIGARVPPSIPAREQTPGSAAAARPPPPPVSQDGFSSTPTTAQYRPDGSVARAGFLPGGRWVGLDGQVTAPPADQVGGPATAKDLATWKPIVDQFAETFFTGSGPYGRPWISGGHVHPGHDPSPWMNLAPSERTPESFFADLAYNTPAFRNMPMAQLYELFGVPGSEKREQFNQLLKDAALKRNPPAGPGFDEWACRMEGIDPRAWKAGQGG